MRLRVILYCLLLTVVISLPAGASSAAGPYPDTGQAPEQAVAPLLPVTGVGWQKITVDAGPNVDQTLSLAINPLTQQPYISYYSAAVKDLKLAFPVSSGGDCGPGNTWSCSSIQYVNSEDFGPYSSIDFNSAGNWGISYVKMWPLTGVGFHGTPVSGNTQLYTGVETSLYSAYASTSFRYAANGTASFAYLGFDGINFYLNFAYYNPLSSGTCGMANHWDCEKISKVYPVGLGTSPSLAYAYNFAMIAYRDSVYGHPYVAGRVASNLGNCPFSANWQCNLVDMNTVVAGGVSLVSNYPSAGAAYYDASPLHPYFIVADGKSGNCGWTCMYIENVGAQPNDDAQTAIAMRSGKYIAAYTDRRVPNNTLLKIAYQDPDGNCGPINPATTLRTWRCEVVDNGGGSKNVGRFLSMRVTSGGVVYIAYSNDTDHTLKLAYRFPQVYIPLMRR